MVMEVEELGELPERVGLPPGAEKQVERRAPRAPPARTYAKSFKSEGTKWTAAAPQFMRAEIA